MAAPLLAQAVLHACMSVAATPSALSLRTPAAVYSYLEGRWAVKKRLDYATPLGWRGNMEGEVTVEPRATQPSVLMWQERGDMRLDSMPGQRIPTHKNLAVRCNEDWPVSVFFVDGELAEATDDGWGVKKTQNLFVHLRPEPNGELRFGFDHLCINDLYTGYMCFDGPDSFRWDWTIKGPNKDGHITQTFNRIRQ